MKALEMFKECGYLLLEDTAYIIYENRGWYVEFYLRDKTYDVVCKNLNHTITSTEVTVELHKAIHQQLKELKWL